MQIVPVIDILAGRAVSAYRGERERYAPLQSPLSPDPDPASVLQGYLGLFPFTTVYIADLDAIQGLGDNRNLILAMVKAHPSLQFWLDGGSHGGPDTPANVHAVLGSETGITPAQLAAAAGSDPETVLSLDFNGGELLGDATLLEQPRSWPRRCIVMTLRRIGSGEGPDAALLTSLRQQAPDRHWYAAGGIRHAVDLHALAEAGAAGALVATALHRGALTSTDLEDFEKM